MRAKNHELVLLARKKQIVLQAAQHGASTPFSAEAWTGIYAIEEYRRARGKRHGTTTLFPALNVLNGAVLATCKLRHCHQEFLYSLRDIDKAVGAELYIHCIADNYAIHSHPNNTA